MWFNGNPGRVGGGGSHKCGPEKGEEAEGEENSIYVGLNANLSVVCRK